VAHDSTVGTGPNSAVADTPLVIRPSARKEMPRNEQRLKEILEHGA
jgi:hypothetical protein